MLTKYITAVKTSFSPFNARTGKTVRNFLAMLPPNARSTMSIEVKMLGRAQAEQPADLSISFSMSLRMSKFAPS
jgi:large subunit ribosomal protein L53